MNCKKIIYLLIIIIGFSACKGVQRKDPSIIKIIDSSIIHFKWKSFNHNGTEYKHGAMMIPFKIDRIDKEFEMQFDLGLNVNVIYENPLNSILKKYPHFKKKIAIGKDYEVFKINTILDHYQSNVDSLFIIKNHGDNSKFKRLNVIGSIGANEIEKKILIIDFKQKTLEIKKELNDFEEQNYEFIPLEYKYGKIFLSLNVSGKTYKYMLDTGASLTPITTIDKEFYNLVNQNSTKKRDTLLLSSWGKTGIFIGSEIVSPISISNYLIKTTGKRIYFTEEESIIKTFNQIDVKGLIGNELFIDNVIVIDLVDNRFGISK
jgi:hypothetical protein